MGNWIKLYLLIVFHVFVVVGNLAAFFILPFKVPFYVALPIMSYIFTISFSRDFTCPLTAAENRLRRKMDLPEIKGFIGHYFVKPYRRLMRRMK